MLGLCIIITLITAFHLFCILCSDRSYVPAKTPCDRYEAEDCYQYGDLEVFLFGLQLQDVLPLLLKHHVNFPVLLTLTDDDLKQVEWIIYWVGRSEPVLSFSSQL